MNMDIEDPAASANRLRLPIVTRDSDGTLAMTLPDNPADEYSVGTALLLQWIDTYNDRVRLRAGVEALRRAALAVADRWDADEVDAGLMDDDIGRLRLAVGRSATPEVTTRASAWFAQHGDPT